MGRKVAGEVLSDGTDDEAGTAGGRVVVEFLAVAVGGKVAAITGHLEGAGVVIEVPGHGRVLAVAEVEPDGRIGAGEVLGAIGIARAVVLGDVAQLGRAEVAGPEGGEQGEGGCAVERTSRGGGSGWDCHRVGRVIPASRADEPSLKPGVHGSRSRTAGWRTWTLTTPSRDAGVVSGARGDGCEEEEEVSVDAGVAGRWRGRAELAVAV